MEREVYVCVTLYHLYLSLLMIENKNNSKNSVILLNANDKGIYKQFRELTPILKNHGFMCDVRLRNKWKDVIGFEELENKKQYRVLSIIFGQDVTNKYILYNFAWNCQYVYTTANIYFKKCKSAVFVEEGALTAINPPQSKLKIIVKKLQGGTVDFYKNAKLQSIYVQHPEIYPKDWGKKIKKLDVSKLLAVLDENSKKMIADIFLHNLTDVLTKQLVDVGIIYTQPLSEDGFITEQEKLNYYHRIVEFYSKYGTPVIKLHPRDTSDYHFEDKYTVLPSYFPSELLGLLGIHFKYAVGICTSAVPNTDADYKININENFLADLKFHLEPLENLK